MQSGIMHQEICFNEGGCSFAWKKGPSQAEQLLVNDPFAYDYAQYTLVEFSKWPKPTNFKSGFNMSLRIKIPDPAVLLQLLHLFISQSLPVTNCAVAFHIAYGTHTRDDCGNGRIAKYVP